MSSTCFNALFGKKVTPPLLLSLRVWLFFNQPTGLMLSDGTQFNLIIPPSSCTTKEGFTSKAIVLFVFSKHNYALKNTNNLHANLNIHFPGILTLDLVEMSSSNVFKFGTAK